jgi:glutamate transport system permease protein
VDVVLSNLDTLLHGFLASLELIAASAVLAFIGGCVVAMMRICPVPLLQKLATAYTETLRNVPTAVILFFTLFALPQIGLQLSFFGAALVGLSVYYAAFVAESIRSGINAIPTGQFEAARALGMSFGKTVQLVVLPQSLRAVVPPLINNFIALTKSSAIASAFGVTELLASADHLIPDNPDAVMAILATVAVFYLLITIPAGLVSHHLERKAAMV